MVEKTALGAQTFLFPMPAVVVGVMVNNRPNFMTVAWTGIACAQPPMLSMAVRKQRFTYEGLTIHGLFSVNVPKVEHAEWVDYFGIVSGREEDKTSRAGIDVMYRDGHEAPMIAQCPVNLMCRVEQMITLGTHDLIVGQIVQTYVDEDCLVRGVPDVSKIDPLVYATGRKTYHGLGATVAKAYRVGLSLRSKKPE